MLLFHLIGIPGIVQELGQLHPDTPSPLTVPEQYKYCTMSLNKNKYYKKPYIVSCVLPWRGQKMLLTRSGMP
jgi:hypothetical protein